MAKGGRSSTRGARGRGGKGAAGSTANKKQASGARQKAPALPGPLERYQAEMNADDESDAALEMPTPPPAARDEDASTKDSGEFEGRHSFDEDVGMEDEPVQPKQKPGRPKKQVAGVSPNVAQPTTFDISYDISLFLCIELQKSMNQREAKGRHLVVSNSLEWEDFRAQVKVQVADALFPQCTVVDDGSFTLFFTITRVVKNSHWLHDGNDYVYLLNKVKEAKAPAGGLRTVQLIVHESINMANKENTRADEDDHALQEADKRPTKRPKTKAAELSDQLPGNAALKETVAQLRARWQCSAGGCSSDHCFVPADGPHLRLTHEHFKKWAGAILRGPDTATIDHPPNHKLFDAVRANAPKSALLQARLNATAKERQATATQPVVNVVLPNDMFGMINRGTQDQAGLAAVPTRHTGAIDSDSLIPFGQQSGERLSLSDFCTRYDLPSAILTRLEENAYRNSSGLRFVRIPELVTMGFKPGEIADLRDAVEQWSIPAL
ncbi:hypothetical protein H1R20_g822, partial [Candolleomyces eurysporus]